MLVAFVALLLGCGASLAKAARSGADAAGAQATVSAAAGATLPSNRPALGATAAAAVVTVSNPTLSVALDTADATLAVTDRRSGIRTVQKAPSRDFTVLSSAVAAGGRGIDCTVRQAGEPQRELRMRLRLEADAPEFTLEIEASSPGAAPLPKPLRFPHPFATNPGEYLVVPMNEGITYPVEDPDIKPFTLIAYGGHGICMAFWGVTDGTRGHSVIIETPDDATLRGDRLEGRLVLGAQWDAQRGQFGYARRLRYTFHASGGHVAIAKRYRIHAQNTGLFRTLAEKRRTHPAVDRLLGAVNVWCWDADGPAIAKELQAAGIERILWSNAQKPENLRALNALGVLTSRYDLFQDVMDPAQFSKLRSIHNCWPTAAWPKDLMLKADGDWVRGWGVRTKDGEMISCGVLCDSRAVDYARERITAELRTHPYLARFIDTTTASPWRECYHPDHPMTRSQSREWKMRLLEYVCREAGLVTGCETGHDASVPWVHFFEGMLSLGPYRVPDSGRDMKRIWTEVPERVEKFQTGHGYRIPLWELVYHECVVAQWYWGDYNNKLPALWDRRDLFNLLYGTPPMFMFDRALWAKERERFVRSYRTVCPTVHDVALHEMTDHRFLTSDRAVQRTRFANGTEITVNFGATPFRLDDGRSLAPLGHDVRKR